MSRTNKKGEIKPSPAYDISGKVGGHAVIVQGEKAHVDVTQRAATPTEIKQQAEEADLILLKQSLIDKLGGLHDQVSPLHAKTLNPYRLGQALGFNEANLLMGRANIVGSILEHLLTEKTVFLAGNGGSGKTSLLQAGLLPRIVKQGGLPVYISITRGSFEIGIKREFLGKVTETEYLSGVSLSTFLKYVTGYLPGNKQVYLLIDRFEDFFDHHQTEIETFKEDWIYCTNHLPNIHWIFSIHSGYIHLLNFFRPDINPFGDLQTLSPLNREDARRAILIPAADVGIKVDEAVVRDILDRLGGLNIDPTKLQTICYLMAGGNGPIQLNWTMAEYEASGRADGILRQSLERLIGQLNHEDRETAWKILAAMIERANGKATVQWLANHLRPDGVNSIALEKMLRQLEDIHLIDLEDGLYYLSSMSLRPRIQQWVNERSALVQARHEALHQLQQLRNSAMRGLMGGALGFVLFDQLIYAGPSPDISYLILSLTITSFIGGIAGFLITLSVDLSISSYSGSHLWIRYLIGGLGGCLASMIALILYSVLNYAGNSLIYILLPTVIVGGVWGLVIGMSATLIMSTDHHLWLKILLCGLLCGLTLFIAELNSGVLIDDKWRLPSSLFRVFLAGTLTPVFYFIATRIGRHNLREGGT